MTGEQYERWLDFSTRMASACFSAHRRPTGAWIAARVKEFVQSIRNVPAVIDWDHSTEGEYCVCDFMSLYQDEFEPHWNFEERIDWDKSGGADRLWDIEMLAFEQWDEQFFGPVRCCVRAGLDLASSPSAGVLGFNVGHIRDMYPEGIPEWVAEFWESDIRAGSDIQGVWL